MSAGFAITAAAVLATTFSTDRAPMGKTTAEDAVVLTTALQHFIAEKGMMFGAEREKNAIVLILEKQSMGPSPIYLSAAQVQSEVPKSEWDVPTEAAENLRRRNAVRASLSDLKFGKGIQFHDVKKPETDEDGLDLLVLRG